MGDSLKTKITSYLLGLSRNQKRFHLIAFDSVLILLVLWVNFFAYYGSSVFSTDKLEWIVFPLAVAIAIPIYIKMGLYRAVLRFFRSQAVGAILLATLISTAVWFGLISLLNITQIPISIVLLYWLGVFTAITGARLSVQQWLYGEISKTSSTTKKVLIYGAGSAGTQLAMVFKSDPTYSLVGFIDDDKHLAGWNVLGLKVFSPLQLPAIIEKHCVDEVILAIPSANRLHRRRILDQLEKYPLHVRSIPAFADLVSGKLQTSDIKDVDIDDLLGRNIVEPDVSLLPTNITNKVVMVTGAGGSIGSELCRQVLSLAPKKLILLEQSEFALYQIEQELEELIQKSKVKIQINRVLGSITNEVLLERLFQNKTIQTIYHAAAYKHVPLVEENPVAGLSNNVFGTQLLAETAMKANVEAFILISTDKAVRPTNVMGCSKRIAEMVLQALAQMPESQTTFTMVRFGNVLGSSGSVVPKFRQQIRECGPITVTHKDITRFFMSIPEAVQLVIQAGAMAKGGDVFVLDMGESVKIADLAEKMINLSGLSVKSETNPEGDIEIEYSGLRPGEKLYEELLIGENVSGTKHKRIMRANEIYMNWNDLQEHLSSLQIAMKQSDVTEIKSRLTKIVDGYQPWIESKSKSPKSSMNKIINIR